MICCKYKCIYTLLYNELLFGGVVYITAAADADTGTAGRLILLLITSQLRDSFDIVDYGASWFIYPANIELLAGADTALFVRIRRDYNLATMFVIHLANNGGLAAISPQAVAVYEATA